MKFSSRENSNLVNIDQNFEETLINSLPLNKSSGDLNRLIDSINIPESDRDEIEFNFNTYLTR